MHSFLDVGRRLKLPVSRITWLIGIFLLVVCLTMGCGGGGGDDGSSADVSVAISPTTATPVVGTTQTFVATVSGSSDTSVSWYVLEGATGGTIDSSGVYTAPATTGTFHVVATSNADTTKAATATITVQPSPGVTLAVSPTNVVVVRGGSQSFTAIVSGASDASVTWVIQEGAAGGSITSAGVYTAPSTTGTYHITVTSVEDPSKTASATVTVQEAPTVSVAVSPTVTTRYTNGTETFTATVSGSTNSSVTWSVLEGSAGGTITTSGVYTAPATIGTYHVVATSVADTTKSATATVTVQKSPPPPGGSSVIVN